MPICLSSNSDLKPSIHSLQNSKNIISDSSADSMKNLPESAQKVVDEFLKSSSTTLNLSNQDINELPSDFFSRTTKATKIILTGNNLTSLPVIDNFLINLVELNLNHNSFSSFSSGIFNKMPNLEKLNLQTQKIKEEYILKKFPTEIFQLQKLKCLDLSHNSLEEIPENISELNLLSELTLANNLITDLPCNFKQLKKLQTIDLTGNKLKTIGSSLQELEQLQIALFSHNTLENFPGPEYLPKNLITLDLESNQITDISDDYLLLLSNMTLILGNNPLSPGVIEKFQNNAVESSVELGFLQNHLMEPVRQALSSTGPNFLFRSLSMTLSDGQNVPVNLEFPPGWPPSFYDVTP